MMWSSLSSFRALARLLLFLSMLLPRPASSNVVINEVYYDHPGSDDGWEFVEIMNTGPSRVDLAGWSLEFLDGASGRAARLWSAGPGSGIDPGEILCVAGARRSPPAGWELGASLGNGPDAVRLLSPTGTADLVGYGPLALADLFESSPAADAPAGWSLARKPDGSDSDRNEVDFVVVPPSPGRRNFFGHDLEPLVRSPVAPPCRGETARLHVIVLNRGIEPVSGIVTARVAVSSPGGAGDSILRDLVVDLAPGESDSTPVDLAIPSLPRFEVEVALACGHDENPSNDRFSLAIGASPGEAVVNEIMYRPDVGGSEWIEVFFPSAGCDLAGWTIGDQSGARRLIAGDSLIAPGGSFLVLARDSASFVERYPLCLAPVRSPAGGWPALNDTGDEIADAVLLHDREGVCVERAAYPPLVGDERGRSIERVSVSSCSSQRGGLWHRSAARDGATPGEPNSTATDRSATALGLSIAPNPFSPRRGPCAVTGALAPGETGMRLRIYSLAGIELRRLLGESGGAAAFGCPWDGRDEGGSVVPSGIYVCLVEYLGPGGGVCRREKACIVVAGG